MVEPFASLWLSVDFEGERIQQLRQIQLPYKLLVVTMKEMSSRWHNDREHLMYYSQREENQRMVSPQRLDDHSYYS